MQIDKIQYNIQPHTTTQKRGVDNVAPYAWMPLQCPLLYCAAVIARFVSSSFKGCIEERQQYYVAAWCRADAAETSPLRFGAGGSRGKICIEHQLCQGASRQTAKNFKSSCHA